MRQTGPPLQPPDGPFRAEGHGLKPMAPSLTEPVTSTIERASELLGCQPDELARAIAAAGLEPYMVHASGAPTFRWPELLEAAGRAGITVPRARPTLAAWKRRQAARQGAQATAAKAKAAKREAGPP